MSRKSIAHINGLVGASASPAYRLDAAQTAFVERQLESIEAEVIRQPYPELIGRQVVPVTHKHPAGTQTIVYRIMDRVGLAQRIKSYADNLERADVHMREAFVPVHVYGLGYGYSFAELRAAAKAGRPLDGDKAAACREGFEMRVDMIAAQGNGEGLTGLLNVPNATQYVVPNGAAGTPGWPTKTGEEMLKDLQAINKKSAELTNGIETPDTLLCTLEAYHLGTSTFIDGGPGGAKVSVFKFFLDNSPYIKTIIPWFRCKGAGAGGTDRLVAYRRDPTRVSLEIPMEWIFHSAQERGLGVEVPGEGEVAGVICKRPLSVTYADAV